jgi:hypothetical protein
MAIVIFVFSFILLAAGAASGYASLDLLPTGLGVMYALAGAIAVSAAVITFALAVAIRRIDRLTEVIQESVSPAISDIAPASAAARPEEFYAAPAVDADARESLGEPLAREDVGEPLAREDVGEPLAREDESPININRAGHFPSLETVEAALETPQAPPNLVGSYSSGGANYRIFADGSIEAELNERTLKFASMSEFKGYLAEKKGDRETGA